MFISRVYWLGLMLESIIVSSEEKQFGESIIVSFCSQYLASWGKNLGFRVSSILPLRRFQSPGVVICDANPVCNLDSILWRLAWTLDPENQLMCDESKAEQIIVYCLDDRVEFIGVSVDIAAVLSQAGYGIQMTVIVL
jgi:hypothetical protein